MSPADRVLLLQGSDPSRPDDLYWFSIGGGIEPGESPRAAAVRELREEVGLVCSEGDLIGPFHHGRHSSSSAGTIRRTSSQFFALPMEEVVVRAVGSADERIDAAAWWAVGEVRALTLSNPALADVVVQAVEVVRGHSRPG